MLRGSDHLPRHGRALPPGRLHAVLMCLAFATGCGDAGRSTPADVGPGPSPGPPASPPPAPGPEPTPTAPRYQVPEAIARAERRAESVHPDFVRGLRATVVGWCDTVPAGMPLVAIETLATVRIRVHSGGVEVERDGETVRGMGSFFDPASGTVLVDADLVAATRERAERALSLAIALSIVDGFAQAIEHEAHERRSVATPDVPAPTPRLKGALLRHYLIPGLAADAVSLEALEGSRQVVELAEAARIGTPADGELLGRVARIDGEAWSTEFLAGFRDGISADQLGLAPETDD